jgi:hypothetical protein
LDTPDSPQTETVTAELDAENGLAHAAKSSPTRRRFMKGTAAAAGGALAVHYVKPNLRSLGVPAALAVSQPGYSGGGTQGCTPGFWGNEGIASAGGKELWNVANDADWNARHLAGGDAYNPFRWDTLFTDVFASHPDLVGRVMYVDGKTDGTVDASGNGMVVQAARHLVAGYLNAAFGLDYPYTKARLKQMWADAVADGSTGAFEYLKNLLDTANNLGCVISGSGSTAPATTNAWTGSTTGSSNPDNLVQKKPK